VLPLILKKKAVIRFTHKVNNYSMKGRKEKNLFLGLMQDVFPFDEGENKVFGIHLRSTII
jgi:hypothetical protein